MTKQELLDGKLGKLKFLPSHVGEGYIVKSVHNDSDEVYITLMPINAKQNRFYAVRISDGNLNSITVKSMLVSDRIAIRLDEWNKKTAAKLLGSALDKELRAAQAEGLVKAAEYRDRRSSRLIEGQQRRSRGESSWMWSR